MCGWWKSPYPGSSSFMPVPPLYLCNFTCYIHIPRTLTCGKWLSRNEMERSTFLTSLGVRLFNSKTNWVLLLADAWSNMVQLNLWNEWLFTDKSGHDPWYAYIIAVHGCYNWTWIWMSCTCTMCSGLVCKSVYKVNITFHIQLQGLYWGLLQSPHSL